MFSPSPPPVPSPSRPARARRVVVRNPRRSRADPQAAARLRRVGHVRLGRDARLARGGARPGDAASATHGRRRARRAARRGRRDDGRRRRRGCACSRPRRRRPLRHAPAGGFAANVTSAAPTPARGSRAQGCRRGRRVARAPALTLAVLGAFCADPTVKKAARGASCCTTPPAPPRDPRRAATAPGAACDATG